MNRYWNPFVAVAALGLGLLAAAPAQAASLTMVPRATWGATGVPSYMQMYIYVPDRVATKPPIYISCHSCGSTATGQISNIPMAKAQADAQGFILILPDNPGKNCWDVGTTQRLKHDGGGDTHAVAQMIKYALSKYNADPARVYIMGGSGGAMLVQAMLAVYPDLFRAGSARAGVAAGCWADGYAAAISGATTARAATRPRRRSSGATCSRHVSGLHRTPAAPSDLCTATPTRRSATRTRPRSIKEWTNVLGLSMTPTSMDTGYKAAGATFNRQFWKNSCGQTVFEAWTAPGANHSMAYEEAEMLKFFGLDAAGVADPEMDCTGSTGTGGAGGAAGAGGAPARPGLRAAAARGGTARDRRRAAGAAAPRAPPARRAAPARRAPPERRAAPAPRARPARA